MDCLTTIEQNGGRCDATEDAAGNYRIQHEVARDLERLSRYGYLDAGDGGAALVRYSASDRL